MLPVSNELKSVPFEPEPIGLSLFLIVSPGDPFGVVGGRIDSGLRPSGFARRRFAATPKRQRRLSNLSVQILPGGHWLFDWAAWLLRDRRTFCMAGAAGFEPANAGIKTQCLAAWRRPNQSVGSD